MACLLYSCDIVATRNKILGQSCRTPNTVCSVSLVSEIAPQYFGVEYYFDLTCMWVIGMKLLVLFWIVCTGHLQEQWKTHESRTLALLGAQSVRWQIKNFKVFVTTKEVYKRNCEKDHLSFCTKPEHSNSPRKHKWKNLIRI